MFWVFFAIIGFIAIYFPFFAPNLRYQTSNILSIIFHGVGTLCVCAGGLMLAWGLLTLFCSRSTGGIKMMLLGFIVLWIGVYCLNPGYFGIITGGGKEVPKGYH